MAQTCAAHFPTFPERHHLKKYPSSPAKNNKTRRTSINPGLLALTIAFTVLAAAVFTIGAFASGDREARMGAQSPAQAVSESAEANSLSPSIFAPVAAILYVDGGGVCAGNLPCYTTIQAAINAAAPGDTINVYAGTYSEQININKTLTLLGPNANINPNTGSRVAEAIIIPTASDPLNPAFTGPLVVRFSANGITFRGFTVDGDNPSLTSGVLYNGVDVDAEIGIYGTETSDSHAVIINNIVKNIGENAIWLTDVSTSGAKTAGGQISANKVDNCIGRFGQGIRIADNAWVDILNNVVTRVRNGIVIENFDGTPPTHPASVVGNNNVSSFRIGIRHNNHYVYSAPGFTISNNTVAPYVQGIRPPQVIAIETTPTAYQAIRVESIQVGAPVLVAGNTMTGNRSALSAGGYTRDEGINVTNNLTTSPNIIFRGNVATDFIRGAFHETPAVPTFNCNSFVANTTGVYLSSAATNGLIAHTNNIVGNGFGMQNDGAAIVNAQANWWGAANGPGPVGPGSGDKVSTGVDFSNWLTVTPNCPPPCPTNVARSTYGATAIASSQYSAGFPASGAIDGEHDGNNWGSGGGWNDGTRAVYPDNIQVNFNVVQTIDTIDVYTLKDQPNNGSLVGDFTTFTYNGNLAFDVQYWNGASWVTVPGGSVTGNNRVKRRFSFGAPITTDKIRVVVTDSADHLYSRVVEIEAFSCSPVVVPTPTPTPTPSPTPCASNVARASNGSTAVATSTLNANFPASGAIDGEHNGNNWGSGGGWNDGTRAVYPDNIQVNFNADQTISRIEVYTLKNAPNNGSIVDGTTPATFYGIRDFSVQYWTGAAWANVPGGAVTGNTLAKRSFSFPDITTDKIRVVVTDSADHLYSRVIEIEAFSCNPVVARCVNPGGTGGCFSTIQAAVNAAAPGDQVNVAAGTYDEDVNVNKANLKLIGAGANVTNIRGPIGGPGTTVQVTASNVTIAGFTITRLGNNTTDWNNPALNLAGIAVQGQAITGMLVRDNVLTGNRTAVDVNDSNGHTIRNNVIDFNRTGLIYRNRTDNQTVLENFITNNWTVGVLFLDGSNVGTPPQSALHSTFSNNNISANWYGQIVDRQSGGSLPAPNTTNLKNFRGNWYGTTSPVRTTANSAEPPYAGQIPTAYGGSATAPGGQPDIAGPASDNFRVDPILLSGTDTNVETTPGRGTFGFQGATVTLSSPADTRNWLFFDDFGSGSGSGGFEAGPATPPLGAGSAFLTVDATARHAFEVFTHYAGTRMDDITALRYSSYQDNNANTVLAISLQFDIDYDLTDANNAFQGRLVFEPYLTGTVQQNVWQTWDARAGNWYASGAPGNGVCTPAVPCTWQQVLTAFPNAGIRNTTTSGLLFKAGGPWSPGFDGNVDAFNVGIGGFRTTYDFEAVP